MGQPGFVARGQGSMMPNQIDSLGADCSTTEKGMAVIDVLSIPKHAPCGKLLTDATSAVSCAAVHRPDKGSGGRHSVNGDFGTSTGCANQYTNFCAFRSANVNRTKRFRSAGSNAAAPERMSLKICTHTNTHTSKQIMRTRAVRTLDELTRCAASCRSASLSSDLNA